MARRVSAASLTAAAPSARMALGAASAEGGAADRASQKRRMAIVAAVLLAVAAPAKAEVSPAEGGAGALQTSTGEALLSAAYATCLSLGDQGNAAAEAFAAAGWDVTTDEEAGFSEIAGPEGLSALTWTDGGYCLVQSETIGSDRAAVLLADVIAASGASAVQETAADGCLSFDLAGGSPRAEVASSGNDPVCRAEDSSGVSFMWAETANGPAE